jgi:hypothetical protein
MNRSIIYKVKQAILISFSLFIFNQLQAQTDMDGIMMEKNAFCLGPGYSYNTWKNYWEGTLKRNNLNLGNVSTQMYSLMGTYGLTRKLNLLFNVPYVKTKASAGTLHGEKGIQDLDLFVKWIPIQKRLGDGKLTLIGIGGASFPLTNYQADYLPLSIGLHSTTASARVMIDYEQNKLFATASGTYVFRGDITIDRNSYYTTQEYLTNKVDMPNATNFNFRAGYRSLWLIAEAVVNKWTTLGGFDITRNNMPFPSNKMNATTVGLNFKYRLKPIPQLSIVVGGNTTIAGRNMGQTNTIYGSLFYVFDFSKKAKTNKQAVTNTNSN